jgi:uncharacterized GH25 family protein
MRRAAMLAAAIALMGGAAAAHDFWLQPQAFRVAPGAEVPVAVMVGDGPEKQRSPIRGRRVVRVGAVGPAGAERDLKAAYVTGEDVPVRLAEPGAHVLVLATDDGGRSRLPAEKFEAYLREEGLTPALEARARSGTQGVEGNEAYGRRAKAIVQVGTGGPQGAATQAVGLSLEIVPEASPYALRKGAALPVRVFYEGRPLAGASVKLADLGRDALVASQVTDAAGRARFAMPGPGAWRLAVVWTKALPETAETDFETVFSSLTFGTP